MCDNFQSIHGMNLFAASVQYSMLSMAGIILVLMELIAYRTLQRSYF